MHSVYTLHFVEDRDNGDVDLIVGVYQSREKAKAAIDQVKDRRGFRDSADGFFRICKYELDETGYVDGFEAVVS